MKLTRHIYVAVLPMLAVVAASTVEFTPEKMASYRNKVKAMFYHAYNGYLRHAFPLDELKPITCSGMDTWGSFSLTLVDALDTLLIMGNTSEFIRASEMVLKNINLNANVNVSVFETNIRVIGGLLSAHMLSGQFNDVPVEPGWPCSGPLLRLAERTAQKLLPAFNTDTGMPFGSVNLRYGVNRFETPITCTAGVGTFILEFGALSRLTGNPHFERLAMQAMNVLYKQKSALGLVGNHINIQTGAWTALDSGIGAGVDSYFEYLVKGAILFQKPELMRQFHDYHRAIDKHVRQDDWFMWVSMNKGQVSMPVFQSLEAFWPGLLTLVGKVDDAMRIMLTYNQVLRQYGFPPEFYNIPNQEAVHKRTGYPLRPELAESLMYLYRATEDPYLLQMGANMIDAIEHSAKTPCGYATVHNVKDHTIEDRMESFFLSETTKYLYLLFDPDNFIHNDGETGRIVDTPTGQCVIGAGGYVFNTEAHPLDPGVVYCCSERKQRDARLVRDFYDHMDVLELIGLNERPDERLLHQEELPAEVVEISPTDSPLEPTPVHPMEEQEDEHDETAEHPHGDDELYEEDEQSDGSEEGRPSVRQHPLAPVPTSAVKKVSSGVDAATFVPTARQSMSVVAAEKPSAKPPGVLEKLSDLLKSIRFGGEETGERVSNEFIWTQLIDNTVQKEWKNLISTSGLLDLLDREMAALPPCSDCCRQIEVTSYRPLRRLLTLMHRQSLRRHALGAQGPLCAIDAQPTDADNYSNVNAPMPYASDEQLTEVSVLRFGSFEFERMSARYYELFSCPAQPFASKLTGLGQVSIPYS